ncbi:MAG: 4Fe-4S binding protein [Vicinamibacteria bacterium]
MHVRSAQPRPETPLTGPELRARRRRVEWTRRAVQAGFLLIVLAIGGQFARWVHSLETATVAGSRPPGVEAFLPIAALLSLRHLAATGVVDPVHPAGLVLLLLALGSALLLKKAFCSWVCPVGFASELLARASRRVLGRYLVPPRWLDLPLRSLKYLLLAFFVHAIFFAMDAADVAAFLDSPYHRVADVKMLFFFERLSPFGLGVLATLALLSLLVPYFWCRYLCPYGALLGAASLLSLLKVTRHAPSCVDCGLCTKACPARLPVERLARVRSDECVGCLSCVAACPVPRALRVETPSPWAVALGPAALAVLVVSLFAGGVALARATGHWRSSTSDAEYAERLRELDSPRYDHLRGAPSRTEGATAR